MDLAKIIADLRVELQCIDTAIASIEELARVQNILIADASVSLALEESESVGPVLAPEKRKRGRPRKVQPPAVDEPTPTQSGGDDPPDETSPA